MTDSGVRCQGLRLGVASKVLTPPVGGELSGFIARVEPMAGVHDDLTARAMVWAEDADETEVAVLVTLYTNPFTIVPLYVLAYEYGKLLLGGSDAVASIKPFEPDWSQGFARCLGVRLAGDAIAEMDTQGDPIRDDTFLLLVNASHEDVDFVPPAPGPIEAWQLLVNTARDPGFGFEDRLEPGSSYTAPARSLALLVRRNGAD